MHWSYFCTKSYCSWPHCLNNLGHSPSRACGVFLCVRVLRIDDTGLCGGGHMVRFTAISTLAYCVPVSVSAFNAGPLVVTRTRIVVVVVGRVSIRRSRNIRTSVLLLPLAH